MDADQREILSKMEVVYSDAEVDPSISVSAPASGRASLLHQLYDSNWDTPRKWFTLYNNKLNGTFYPIDTSGASQVGWWGTLLSDAQGALPSSQSVSVLFDARVVENLLIGGDSVAGNYPVDFTISFYGAGDVLIKEIEVVGNSSDPYVLDMSSSPVLNVVKMTLSIHKISKPNEVARITEFFDPVVEVYTKDDRLMVVSIYEEREVDSGSLPLGNISANEIAVKLRNDDRHFDTDNPNAFLNNLLKPNRKIRLWLGVRDTDNSIIWSYIGTFWSTTWNAPTQTVEASVTARDLLYRMGTSKFETSQVYTNFSLYQLAEEVLHAYGLSSNQYVIDSELSTVIVPKSWFDVMSFREALRLIAEAGLAVVFMGRDDKLHITRGTTTGSVVYTFDEDKNLFNLDRPPVWSKIVNHVTVNYTSVGDAISRTVLDVRNLDAVIPAGQSETFTLRFHYLPVTQVTNIELTGHADLVVTNSQVYCWGMKLTVTNSGIVDRTLTAVQATGDYLDTTGGGSVVAQDLNSIEDLGELRYSLSNPLIQSRAVASSIASNLLSEFLDPHKEFILDTRGHISLQLGDKVEVPTPGGVREGVIVRQVIEYDGSLSSEVYVRKV